MHSTSPAQGLSLTPLLLFRNLANERSTFYLEPRQTMQNPTCCI